MCEHKIKYAWENNYALLYILHYCGYLVKGVIHVYIEATITMSAISYIAKRHYGFVFSEILVTQNLLTLTITYNREVCLIIQELNWKYKLSRIHKIYIERKGLLLC